MKGPKYGYNIIGTKNYIFPVNTKDVPGKFVGAFKMYGVCKTKRFRITEAFINHSVHLRFLDLIETSHVTCAVHNIST